MFKFALPPLPPVFVQLLSGAGRSRVIAAVNFALGPVTSSCSGRPSLSAPICSGRIAFQSKRQPTTQASSRVVLHEEVEVDRTAAADRQCAPDATVELERRSPSRIHYEATGYSDEADASYGVVPAVGTLIPAA